MLDFVHHFLSQFVHIAFIESFLNISPIRFGIVEITLYFTHRNSLLSIRLGWTLNFLLQKYLLLIWFIIEWILKLLQWLNISQISNTSML